MINLKLTKSFIDLDFLFQPWAEGFRSLFLGFESFSQIRFCLHFAHKDLDPWLGDSDPSIGYGILSPLSEVFVLGSKYTSETLNSLISKHIMSVLVSSKSIRDQPWFNNLLFYDDKTLNQKNRFWFHMNIKLPLNICILIFIYSICSH